MNKVFNRSVQIILKTLSPLLDWSEPELHTGSGSLNNLPKLLKEKQHNRMLIVTDKGIIKVGLLDSFIQQLEDENITYRIYDAIEPNPTIEMSEEIAIHYHAIHADVLVAVGGGSVIDAAKAAGIVLSQPHKPLSHFRGLLKVWKKTPYTVAVPTTAGTGSEGTIASVLTSADTQEKYAIMDHALTPDMAVLDPDLTKTLSKSLIAGPGMDAITHAVEAYIGQSNTNKTEDYAKKTVRLISENLKKVYDGEGNAKNHENLLLGSYHGGRAFTRAYVGNVHAISHALSAYYNLPHGRTNATVLPLVLRLYGEVVKPQLSELAKEAGVAQEGNNVSENGELFIEWLDEMNASMGIDKHIPEIKEEDIEGLARHAEKEANPLYPVPVMFSEEDFKQAYRIVKGATDGKTN